MRVAGGFLLLAAASVGRGQSIGLTGIDSYDNHPFCATACYAALSSAPLECSEVHGDSHGDHGHGHGHVMTSADCRRGNVPFLTSLAWCISSKCGEVDDLTTGEIEEFWDRTASGDPNVSPAWTYSVALANISYPPTVDLGHGELMNTTVVPPFFWDVAYGTYKTLYEEGWNMNVFGLIILNVGFGLPIILTWLGCLPYFDKLYEKLQPYLVWPSLIGNYHVRVLPFSLGNAPTVGQALYITVMIALNIVLSAINFQTTENHMWFQSTSQQITGYLMYRTGVLSFAMAPLTLLFAGRNNILLWLTNWKHSTFILLHRWIARLFVIQALLHTILAVAVYSEMGIYPVEAELPYWAWGVVATLFACLMLVFSTVYFRRLSYEIFLISHIIMAVLVIVGSWYHVILRFEILSGHTMWLWTASAVWFFDRLVRVVLIARIGGLRSKVVDIGDGIVRVDIEGVRWGFAPGQKSYVYFPSVTRFRPWENHPFSAIPTQYLGPNATTIRQLSPTGSQTPSDNQAGEKQQALASVSSGSAGRKQMTPGITFFIRKATGMTKALQASNNLFTLLEGPYTDNSTSSILKCDRILLVGGGIGITSLLAWTKTHPNAKLCWTVKQNGESLVRAFDAALEGLADKEIKVGSRTAIEEVLAREVEVGWTKIGVVACGPPALCDDVRAAVVAAGKKHSSVFEFHEDAYSW
ncbi:ferric reductase like transmembrane component-domain-containing protein [Stachybotrys elegans]|uniref:Ferric reductase like transmembrane component-domain-containing protein n=1 Tax=Stachybotrys elegans TaxID=80388 RepID=A0A8K0SR04_9HYPO|nr:ferric reductase like transmembrane component-domain-containing protein [Stachybotrys elegans]